MKKTLIPLLILVIHIQFGCTQNDFQGNYIIASKEKLNIEQLERMSSFELRLMRNEIYARHGYKFKTFFMSEFFNSWDWYKPTYDNVNGKLTELEKQNIKLIKAVENGEYLSLKFENGIITDEEKSSFRMDKAGYKSKSVDYVVSYFNNSKVLIKKTKEILSDNRVDGNYPMTSIELYKIGKETSNLECFKRIKTKDEYVTIYKANKLVYQTKTPILGSDKTLYKIVDVEDNQPFIASNSVDQIFRVRNSSFNSRWISLYEQLSTNDESWVYDRDWKRIKVKNIDDKTYQKIGTIVYSEEDYIYQMIDIFESERVNNRSTDLKIKLIFPDDKTPYEVNSNENDIILKDKGFENFKIGLYIDKELIEIAVNGDEVNIGDCFIERIKIFKRDVSRYKIN